MSENVVSPDESRKPNNEHLIEEYKELHSNRRSHGNHFFQTITWSAVAFFLIYKTIIDNEIPALALCIIPWIPIFLTVTICVRHKQRLKAIDERVDELEKHFKFKAKEYYDKYVPEYFSGVTITFMVLLTLTHLMPVIYGLLIACGFLDDYRNATPLS